ncbi:MAG: PBP1A family penicillin-binding protein [Patescibacteria group bacterium]
MPIKQLLEKIRHETRQLQKSKASRWKIIKKTLITIAVTGLALFLIIAFGLTMVLAWISRDLPDPNALMYRDIPLTTKIYDRTGNELLYEIHGDENRSLIQIKDLPTYVPAATVAIEDKNFYQHHGIDWLGLIRAFIKNTLTGKRIGGTSTLTQQFVKNAILTNERSYERKLKEILLSLQMERVFTKDQILQLYLNEIPYGSTMYGVESAARGYFGKPAKDLTLDEAALLAALPQAPDIYSPYGTGSRGDNRDLLLGRQKYILNLMADQGYVTKEQSEEAKTVDTLKKLVPKKVGNIKAPHFVMYVRSQLIEKYGQNVTERGGLKVITSLDWDKQQIADDEVKKGVENRGKDYNFTNASLVAIDPKTGQIISMVGSKDFFDAENDGQVNVALRDRQPGSSFKPIVYAAGFIKGYTPETTLWDVNTTFKTEIKNYEPKNYDFKEHGPVSVRSALQGSLNIPAVKMLYLVGVGRVLDLAEQMGYSTFGDRSRFGLSLVLGGGEVKLLEHTNAYAAFANEGKQEPLTTILKVEDSKGKVLDEWKQGEGKEVLDVDTARRISDILSDNGARAYVFGSKNYLTLPDRPVAAKTGTTNNFHDAWTLGYTPSLVAGVWVGNNDNTEMKNGADGSKIAAPIWQGFMKRALDKTPVERFPAPAPTNANKPVLLGRAYEVKIKIDKASNKRATELTPPELVEERSYREAHNILWYLDKDDPRGPVPTDPTQDPQFWNWENAVQAWASKTTWNATSTPPTEYDDVHVSANKPSVSIVSPNNQTTLNSRSFDVNVNAYSPRRITHIDIVCEGIVIGSKIFEPWIIPSLLPNSIEKGFHDISVNAYDDVGNIGTAVITINLIAESAPPSLKITDPINGFAASSTAFPVSVSIITSDITNAKKIDLYIQTADGSTRLLGSEISPTSNQLEFQWNYNPGPGKVKIFPVMVHTDDSTTIGEQITVKIE